MVRSQFVFPLFYGYDSTRKYFLLLLFLIITSQTSYVYLYIQKLYMLKSLILGFLCIGYCSIWLIVPFLWFTFNILVSLNIIVQLIITYSSTIWTNVCCTKWKFIGFLALNYLDIVIMTTYVIYCIFSMIFLFYSSWLFYKSLVNLNYFNCL